MVWQVERADLRTKIKIDQEKYVQAAHQSIYQAMEREGVVQQPQKK